MSTSEPAPRPPDDPRNTPPMIRGALLDDGWSDKAIARQVRAGSWVRVRRGAYVENDLWSTLSRAGRHEMTTRAVLAQAGTDVVVSHLSGLPFHDLALWDIRLDEVHVTRKDAHAGRFEAGVRQHRGVLLPEDVVQRHGVAIVSPTRLALEVTTCLDTERALVVVDQLLHRGLTTPEQLRARYETMTTWPRTLRTDLVLRRADRRHESVAETRFDHLCWLQHLPRPTPQHEVRDATGRVVARLDFALPEHRAYRAYIEVDGAQKYGDLVPHDMTAQQVIMAEKKRETLVYDLLGWLCIRVTWRDLQRPVETAQRIRSMLEGRRAA